MEIIMATWKCCLKFISPYVPIFWTKRFVKHRPCGIRGTMRRLKYENRVHKRKNLFQIKCEIECIRKPYWSKKPERRNYNTFYRPMQIPVRRKK